MQNVVLSVLQWHLRSDVKGDYSKYGLHFSHKPKGFVMLERLTLVSSVVIHATYSHSLYMVLGCYMVNVAWLVLVTFSVLLHETGSYC